MFINNLSAYGACQQRTPKLFVQDTANFPFRGRHSEKSRNILILLSNLLFKSGSNARYGLSDVGVPE